MTPDISVVVVSFNTRDLLRDCLVALRKESEGIATEVFVVDSASRDGSADMVEAEFPEVKLIRSSLNLGFAGANNKAFPLATGRYIVLLNSDAFLRPFALRRSIDYMDADAHIGLGGARLIGADFEGLRPLARHQLIYRALGERMGREIHALTIEAFGRQDHTWADQNVAADADWVPGAYSIIRRTVLEEVGYFDEQFFLYYEEVDLCRRIKKAGYVVRYWPDVVVVHLGGESSKTLTNLTMSKSGAQLELWRMRSAFLYYRKHHGPVAWLMKQIEAQWHRLRSWKNRLLPGAIPRTKAQESRMVIELLGRAWRETSGGAVSPSRPW